VIELIQLVVSGTATGAIYERAAEAIGAGMRMGF